MTTQDTYSDRLGSPFGEPTGTTIERRRGVIERCRERRAERKQARLLSARKRRMLARWLRRTAEHTQSPHPLARRRETLLHYRVAAARTDLLEIAAMLEHAPDPDPACLAALHELLANGCDSPLHNAEIHVSELHATLHHLRTELGPRPNPTRSRRRATPERLDDEKSAPAKHYSV
jgi:hypothetical protein